MRNSETADEHTARVVRTQRLSDRRRTESNKTELLSFVRENKKIFRGILKNVLPSQVALD